MLFNCRVLILVAFFGTLSIEMPTALAQSAGTVCTPLTLAAAEELAATSSNCYCPNTQGTPCEEGLCDGGGGGAGGGGGGCGSGSCVKEFSFSGSALPSALGGGSDTCPSTHPGSFPQQSKTTFGFSKGSLIHNATMQFYHWGVDIPRAGSNDVQLTRIFRPIDMSIAGSFGNGMFSNYDHNIVCDLNSENHVIEADFFDPTITIRKLYTRDSSYASYQQAAQMAAAMGQPAPAAPARYAYMVPASGSGNLPSTRERMKSIVLLDNNQQPVTPSSPIASFVAINGWDGSRFLLQLFDVNEYQSRTGRLKQITSSTGANTTVTFKTWTSAELAASPTRAFQIAKVTDRYGKELVFTYSGTQVGGAWVVSQVTSPFGGAVGYTYSAGKLTQVNLLSGATATFVYGTSTTANATTVQINDPAAPDGHFKKKAYLSLQAGSGYNVTIPLNGIRLLLNGNDEVAYLSLRNTAADQLHYEGGGIAKWYNGSGGSYLLPGWSVGQPGSGYGTSRQIIGSVDAGMEYQQDNASNAGSNTIVRHANGQEMTYVNDEFNRTVFTLHSDSTFESWCYNDFSKVTRYRNRQGSVVRSVYDGGGRLIEEHVGLTDNPTTNGSGYGALSQYSRCATDDVQTGEYAVRYLQYVPSNQPGANQVSASIDFNGNRTDYIYDGNGRLSEVKEPPLTVGGPRPSTLYAYNQATGALTDVTDPTGNVVHLVYDSAGRRIKTEYPDGSSDRIVYGTSGDGIDRIVKKVDRGGVVTNLSYDAAGRLITQVQAAGVQDAAGNETATPSIAQTSSYQYVDGTERLWKTTQNGQVSERQFDHRGRTIKEITRPRSGTVLESQYSYIGDKLYNSIDPYGRKTYRAYDATDQRLIRAVVTTQSGWAPPTPGVNETENTVLLNLSRDTTPNAFYVIHDLVYDAGGHLVESYDPLMTRTHITRDSRNRQTNRYQAYTTSLETQTQTLYDAQGNTVELRNSRYFDASDNEGYQKARETWTYNGRNLVSTHTEAPGTAVAATESFTYDLKSRQVTHTDFRGKVWTTIYDSCCDKSIASKNPLGHGSIRNANSLGRIVHTATVADVDQHIADMVSPINSKTLSESTTQYDGLGRTIATTAWLVPLGAVDRENPPIAGLNGVSSADGLTTQYLYDDNLSDGTGLDSAAGMSPAVPAASNPAWKISLASAIAKLASAETAGGAAVNFSATSSGRASVVINPEFEVSFTISDAAGRTVMSGKLDNFTGTANDLLTWSCQAHDTVTNVAGFGNCLESRSIDALGKVTKTLTDGIRRTLRAIDQLGNATVFTYDASGNQLSVRDPNNVGQDVVYDALGRAGIKTDTANHTMNSSYDKVGNKITATDGKNQITFYTFDARGRQKSQTDRLAGVASFTYLQTGQLASMTDAQNQTTNYTYDDAGGKLAEQYPDHTSGNPGDSTYGIVNFVNDAVGRVSRKQDQKGDTCTFNYDLAGRLTSRDYRTAANSPSGTIADSDQFTYDKASRMLTGQSGRYSNTVGYSHDSAGRRKAESLTISGQTYTTTVAFNARGERTQYTYPDGTVVGRSYTERGELYQLIHAGTIVDTRVYDNGGRKISSTYNNGVVESRTYNNDNKLSSISFGGSGSAIGNLGYGWDNNQNKISETITGTMSNYGFSIPTGGYDSEDRLVSFNRTSGLSQSWSLSAVGDWNSVTTNGSAQTRTHGPAHELLTGAGQSVSTDTKGNITGSPAVMRPNGSSLTCTWDFDNRMASADIGSNGSVEVSHLYDALGRRVARTAGGITTVYVQIYQQTIADYVAGAAPASSTYRYVYGSYVDEPVMRWQTSNSSSLYYHRNQQYSITAVSNSAGAVQERYAYTAYGVPTIANASGAVLTASAQDNRYMYTGREWDNDIQQYHFRARMYDASLGRFCSRDPIGYVDGYGLYSAYFAPSALDPDGTHMQDTGAKDKDDRTIYRDLHSKKCYVRDPVNGGPIPLYPRGKYVEVSCPPDEGVVDPKIPGQDDPNFNCMRYAVGPNEVPKVKEWWQSCAKTGPKHFPEEDSLKAVGCREIKADEDCKKGERKVALYEWLKEDQFHIVRCNGPDNWSAKCGATKIYTGICDPDKHTEKIYKVLPKDYKKSVWCCPDPVKVWKE
ncbi:MAG: RHS repeat-associated core domain-containing protein [Pirellulales bacterium]